MRPCVLVFAGHDPCGGAGIQADIQSMGALGVHALPIITAITVQDTVNVKALYPLPVAQVREQAEIVLSDIPIAACKIGLLGNAEIAVMVAKLLRPLNIPVILDPILAAGGGTPLANQALCEALRELFPLASVLTPNSHEARKLAGDEDLLQAVRILGKAGCQHILLTGSHENTPEVVNTLYNAAGETLHQSTWARLPGEYHGSGCTLASALAALLARGLPLPEACAQALDFTWQSLKCAFSPGHGQAIPWR